jgi:hypothetical protein
MKKLYFISIFLFFTLMSIAQCAEGEFEFEIVFYTSDNTENIYWQLDSELDGD